MLMSRVFALLFSWLLLMTDQAGAEFRGGVRGIRDRDVHAHSSVILAQTDSVESFNPFKWFTGSKADHIDEPRKRRVMDAINQFRAQICAEMKDEHDKNFESYESCVKFMEKACRPGKDGKMDGDKNEVTTGKGYCSEYFHEAEKKAEKKVDDEDRENAEAEKKEKAKKGGDSSKSEKKEPPRDEVMDAINNAGKDLGGAIADPLGDSGAQGNSEKKKMEKMEKKESSEVVDEKPTPQLEIADDATSSSSGAPAPAPSPTGASQASSPASAPGGVDKFSSWYYKKNGQVRTNLKTRMHMDEDLGLPTHGYFGKLVAHDDMKTNLGDWQNEIDSPTYDKAWDDVCIKHPNSPWCYERKLSPEHRWKSSSKLPILLLPVALAVLTAAA